MGFESLQEESIVINAEKKTKVPFLFVVIKEMMV